MSRVRIVNDPERFPDSAGMTGIIQRQDPGWDNDGMELVQLDNDGEGLWWPEDLEPLP